MSDSDSYLKSVLSLVSQHGVNETAKKLNIKAESVERYIREGKRRGVVAPLGFSSPKIFIYDLENSPTMAGVWGMWKQDVNLEAILDEWYMLSWSGKWLLDTETYSDVLTPDEAIKGDDKRIMQSLWAFLDEADIVVGHNVKHFDNRKANTRFIVNGISPPSPFRSIDTLLEARKHFSFTSNRLDYLCKQLGLNRKADNGGMERWMGCMRGSEEDLLDMEYYNKQDVRISEELYLALRPYMTGGHPNMGLFGESDMDICRLCGSNDLTWTDKFYYTSVNKYSIYVCNNCKGHGRSRFSAIKKRDHITAPITR